MSDDPKGFSTRAIRAASRAPQLRQRPTSVPIYQTATFTSEDAAALGDIVGDPWAGFSYSRLSNPTTQVLGDAYAELAGGETGYAFASGMGAIHATLASLLKAGDRVVAPTALYGSTRTQLTGYFGRFGVAVELVDATDLDAVRRALAAAPTRVLYAETSANPTTFLADHRSLAALAHEHGATYVVDNTFASTYVCRPLELGADLVLESATKYLGGHSDLMAGVVAGPRALVEQVARVQVDTGATLGPFEAFLVLRGLLTLAVRMDRHGANALALATWLEARDGVRRVLYPGLASHPQHAVAEAQFRPGNGGGMLAFEVAGGREAGPRRHRLAPAHRADRLARQRPHDGRPPAVDVAAPAVRGAADRGRDHTRAAPRERGPRGRARTSPRTSSGRSPRRVRPPPCRPGSDRTRSLASLTIERPLGRAGPSIPARAGMRIWRLFTSVNFAVVQIVAVTVLAAFGMTIRQLPGFAFRSAGDYATEMDKLRTIYEPVLGVGMVDLMERLQLFRVFTSTPFSVALFVLAVSILICTLDRTPRLWQQSAYDPGRPAGRVLRSAPARPRVDRAGARADARGRGGARSSGTASPSARRPETAGSRTCTATGIAGPSSRRSSRTSA